MTRRNAKKRIFNAIPPPPTIAKRTPPEISQTPANHFRGNIEATPFDGPLAELLEEQRRHGEEYRRLQEEKPGIED